MLLKSFSAGFGMLIQPSVFILTLALFSFYILFSRIIQLTTDAKASQGAAAAGCLTQILSLLFQGLWIGIYVLLLLPVLLKFSPGISWQSVEPLGFIAMRAGIFAMILFYIVSFFPWIGPFLARSPGLEVFILASLTFRFLSPSYLQNYFGTSTIVKQFYPNWIFCCIYFIAAIFLTKLSQVLLNYLLLGKSSPKETWKNSILIPNLDIFAGILAFLAYTQYVALKIHYQP